jgi:hypothetical protein
MCRASRSSELPISTPLQILPCIWPRRCCTVFKQSHYHDILFSSELALSFKYVKATFLDAFASALNSSVVQTSSCLHQGDLFDLSIVGTSLVHLYKIYASLACPCIAPCTRFFLLVFFTTSCSRCLLKFEPCT